MASAEASVRLLTIFPSRERGGAEEYALTISRAVVAAGWEGFAAFARCVGTATLREDFEAAGVTCRDLNLVEWISGHKDILRTVHRALRDLANAWRTYRVLRRTRPRVVHLVLPWPLFGLGTMLTLALLRIPTLVAFQLVAGVVEVSETRRRVYAWSRGRGQRWLTISENNRALLSQSFDVPTADLALIHNGAPLPARAEPTARQEVRKSVREELGVPDSARVLLTVGRLSQQKGYHLLAAAVPGVVEECAEARFVWVGDGEDRQSLARTLSERGVAQRVIMTGFRRDVGRLMLAADLFVFPTLFEGLPFALLEAMALDLPIVASDASSLPEVIEHGTHGLLFQAGNPQALEKALLDALRRPERMSAMARRARERVSDFSEERMVRETLALLVERSRMREPET